MLFRSGEYLDEITFECSADDFNHAEEQTLNAYPDCIILSIKLANQLNWHIRTNGEYVYLTHSEHQGTIQVKADVEGFAVDIFDVGNDSIASTWATFEDLEIQF